MSSRSGNRVRAITRRANRDPAGRAHAGWPDAISAYTVGPVRLAYPRRVRGQTLNVIGAAATFGVWRRNAPRHAWPTAARIAC